MFHFGHHVVAALLYDFTNWSCISGQWCAQMEARVLICNGTLRKWEHVYHLQSHCRWKTRQFVFLCSKEPAAREEEARDASDKEHQARDPRSWHTPKREGGKTTIGKVHNDALCPYIYVPICKWFACLTREPLVDEVALPSFLGKLFCPELFSTANDVSLTLQNFIPYCGPHFWVSVGAFLPNVIGPWSQRGCIPGTDRLNEFKLFCFLSRLDFNRKHCLWQPAPGCDGNEGTPCAEKG